MGAGPPLIETGDKLGDIISELRPSESISEFTCGGPKYYAYRLVDTVTGASKTVCKVRVRTLNYSTSKLVNIDINRDMILKGNTGNEPPFINVHTQNKIKRKRKGAGTVSFVTEPEDKIYCISFFKRRRLGDNTSLTFRYK